MDVFCRGKNDNVERTSRWIGDLHCNFGSESPYPDRRADRAWCKRYWKVRWSRLILSNPIVRPSVACIRDRSSETENSEPIEQENSYFANFFTKHRGNCNNHINLRPMRNLEGSASIEMVEHHVTEHQQKPDVRDLSNVSSPSLFDLEYRRTYEMIAHFHHGTLMEVENFFPIALPFALIFQRCFDVVVNPSTGQSTSTKESDSILARVFVTHVSSLFLWNQTEDHRRKVERDYWHLRLTVLFLDRWPAREREDRRWAVTESERLLCLLDGSPAIICCTKLDWASDRNKPFRVIFGFHWQWPPEQRSVLFFLSIETTDLHTSDIPERRYLPQE